MPLDEGTRLGPYEILSPIGAGGMGEVYRAKDSRLGRIVAMKFLPESLEKDDLAQKRFLREARSAAALDHPFICKIYEVGEYAGKLFIAMENVVGAALSQRLTEGPLGIEETLRVSIQIAEALEAAHKYRIIHRDLKPSNIMLTAEGYVKVVDFGLAKQLTLTPDDENEGATIPALTQHGIIIGTVAYMSPEQTRGQDLDERSDIFSLGSVLYEMATGQCSFPGNGIQEVVLSIQFNDPPPLSKYVREIPAELQRIVSKALQKDRNERYQAIGDLRADLKHLDRNLRDQPKLDQKPQETFDPPNVEGVDIFISYDSGDRERILPLVRRLEDRGWTIWWDRRIQPGKDFSDVIYNAIEAAKCIIVVWSKSSVDSKWIRKEAAEGERRGNLVPLLIDDIEIPFQFRDITAARLVGYPQASHETEMHELINAVSTTLAEPGHRAEVEPVSKRTAWGGGTMADSGHEPALAHSARKGGRRRFWWLLSVSVAVLLVVGLYLVQQIINPEIKTVLVPDLTDSSASEVLVPDLVDSSASKVVVPDMTGNSANEAIRILTAQQLVPIDQVPESSDVAEGMVIRTDPIGGDRVEANTAITLYVSSGPPLSVVPNVVGITLARASTQLADANLSIGPQHREAGDLEKGMVIRTNPGAGDRVELNTAVTLYVSAGRPQQMIVFHSDRSGQPRLYAMKADGSEQRRLTNKHGLFPAWSPDGGRIAFTSTRHGNAEIYVMNTNGSNLKRLTFTAGADSSPAWSPDGGRIAFESRRDGNLEIYSMNADGSNQTRLTNDPKPQVVPTWSPDGERIAYTYGRLPRFEIHVMHADGRNQKRLISNADGAAPAWSPDGRRIAFMSRRDGNPEIYVMNADGSGQVRLTSVGGSDKSPAWSPDGRRIAFASKRDGNFEIYSMNADGSNQTRLTRNAEAEHPSWTQIPR